MIAIYIRVSTHEQNLEVQRAEVQRWLDSHGHKDVQWFEDKQTGKNLQRPGFERLQRAIFEGKVQTVVVWRVDRLARRLRDGIKVFGEWMDQGVRLISVTQGWDFSGAAGQVFALILFGFAEMELVALKERQAVGIKAARERGAYKGVGRKRGSTKGKPERARELINVGFSVSEVANVLGVSERTVYRYLPGEASELT